MTEPSDTPDTQTTAAPAAAGGAAGVTRRSRREAAGPATTEGGEAAGEGTAQIPAPDDVAAASAAGSEPDPGDEGEATGAAGADGGTDGATEDGETANGVDTDDGAPPASKRRRVLLVASVVGVLVAVVVAILIARNSGGMEPITVVTTTHTAVAATPETDPIERDTSTALLAALPDTLLSYAVSEQVESETMAEQFALEGWQLTYADSSTAVVLSVGQWPTGDEAGDALNALVGEAEATASGDVQVGGDVVGTFQVLAIDEDTERTIWRNGTVVFVADGPTGTTQAFYDAFPL